MLVQTVFSWLKPYLLSNSRAWFHHPKCCFTIPILEGPRKRPCKVLAFVTRIPMSADWTPTFTAWPISFCWNTNFGRWNHVKPPLSFLHVYLDPEASHSTGSHWPLQTLLHVRSMVSRWLRQLPWPNVGGRLGFAERKKCDFTMNIGSSLWKIWWFQAESPNGDFIIKRYQETMEIKQQYWRWTKNNWDSTNNTSLTNRHGTSPTCLSRANMSCKLAEMPGVFTPKKRKGIPVSIFPRKILQFQLLRCSS